VKNVAHDRQEMHKQFWPGNLKGKALFKDSNTCGRI